eukprot:TRINITY_DN10924_c0_g1_i1.p1 TRINITY_DN10924_c0_g1~~TRINITY_DN10924_c0_g1_i1.p1  ORF type:complete len:348 (+),score=67.12 TRINITY_DN10924_c0_g1_i1:113-1156(+)
MGACTSNYTPSQEEKKRHMAIESQLRHTRGKEGEIKLLLLGTGESGKSTIAKQLRIIHQNGFSDQDRRNYRDTIHSNVISSVRTVLTAARRYAIALQPENEEFASEFLSKDFYELTEDLALKFKNLFSDQGFISSLANRSMYQLADSSEYFFQDIDRIAGNFLPTDEDILRVRVKTLGVKEVLFKANKHFFRLVDVGGQRSERKKWIHCFEGVTAVIFCVALSEYDQRLFEDESVNRMHESMKLFDDLCNSKWFRDKSIILFMNKTDLFEDKIKTVDLKICFPSYTGGMNYDEALKFITKEFEKLDTNKERQLFFHNTCATDTQNIKHVFKDVQSIILSEALDEIKF